MPKQKTFTGTIPDAHYRCEGADLGTEQVAGIHFRAEDGGYFPPDQLFHVKIIDRKGQMECTSFFCVNCVEAYSLKTSGKMTLREAIASKMEQAQHQSAREYLKAAGC